MSQSQLHLLLIEDSPADVRYVQEILKEDDTFSHKLVTVNRLDEGISLLENSQFDLVLLDMSLPDARGLDAIKGLQAENSTIAFVVLTGSVDEKLGMEALVLGAQDYLIKDHIDTQSLIRSIRYAIMRKRAEEIQIKAARLQLELEQERQLRHMRERFIELVSHEFRTPLTIVLSSTNLLDHHTSMPDEQIANHLHKIRQATLSMNTLLDNIFSVSLLDSSQITLYPSQINLQHFCEDLIKDIQEIHTSNQTIRFETDDCQTVYLDGGLLGQILSNLIQNAVLYSSKDVLVSVTCTDENVNITVQDWGLGIPEEDQPYIFHSMYRGQNVKTIHGIGVGLDIVKHAVELHQGTIHIESELNKGTRVRVSLPQIK